MSKILLAFAAGLGLGLLLAPESGADLRDKVGDWFTDAADTARDTVKKGVNRGKSAADDLESRISDAVNS